MRKDDRGKAFASWRFIADLLTGRVERRILALEAQTEALAARVAELEKVVARQDDKLKALADLVPQMLLQHEIDADTPSQPGPDRRKMH